METLKSEATRLTETLRKFGYTIKHSHALEAIASIHGARNWQTLHASGVKSRSKIMSILNKYGLNEDIEIVFTEEDDSAYWLGIKGDDGSISAAVMPKARPGKIYYEGDAANCYAPVSLLKQLTQTTDPSVLEWRQSAEIIAELKVASQAEELSPWTLYQPFDDLDVPSPGPHVVAAVNRKCDIFDVCNGEVVERVKLTRRQKESLVYVGDDRQCLMCDLSIGLGAGTSSVGWFTLGDPGFEVVAGFTETRGLVAYSGVPWHYKMIPYRGGLSGRSRHMAP